MTDALEKISDVGTGWGQMLGLGPLVGETEAQRKARKAAGKNGKKPAAPTPDDATSRAAAQRRRARTKAGTGRAGTMLSSDTLG